MRIIRFLKNEFAGWSTIEYVFFPLIIIFVAFVSLLKGDSLISLICAICGILYTILAGKGRILCYLFGIIATLCYSYLSFLNSFWGNLLLNFCYYLPVSFVGIYFWKKNLKKDKQEIAKTKLNKKMTIVYLIAFSICTCVLSVIFEFMGDKSPFLDSFTTVFSILGMLLTVKRCIEQWYVWFFVNLLSAIMWFHSYLDGANCLAVVIKWLIYSILAVYFWQKWQKELNT